MPIVKRSLTMRHLRSLTMRHLCPLWRTLIFAAHHRQVLIASASDSKCILPHGIGSEPCRRFENRSSAQKTAATGMPSSAPCATVKSKRRIQSWDQRRWRKRARCCVKWHFCPRCKPDWPRAPVSHYMAWNTDVFWEFMQDENDIRSTSLSHNVNHQNDSKITKNNNISTK